MTVVSFKFSDHVRSAKIRDSKLLVKFYDDGDYWSRVLPSDIAWKISISGTLVELSSSPIKLDSRWSINRYASGGDEC